MTKKNKLYIFIFFILIIFSVLVFNNIPCIFKAIFKIPCPGCGMTRAFKELFKLNFKLSLYYNILAIPLIIFFIYWLYLIIKDIINKKEESIDKILSFLSRYYIIIIVLIIIAWILNIYHGI